jgi:hypothetical protein
MKKLCKCKDSNSKCKSWQELTQRSQYLPESGVVVPTMTGERAPLNFRCEQGNSQKLIRVWRQESDLNFTFDEHVCQAICQRFEEGILKGRNFTEGGTAYFNAPDWDNRPLNFVTAPYAAAIIRHARQMVGLRNY